MSTAVTLTPRLSKSLKQNIGRAGYHADNGSATADKTAVGSNPSRSATHATKPFTAERARARDLAAQGEELGTTLDAFGLRLRDVDPSHERTVEIIRRLVDAGLGEETATALFGPEGAAAYLALAERLERFEALEGIGT